MPSAIIGYAPHKFHNKLFSLTKSLDLITKKHITLVYFYQIGEVVPSCGYRLCTSSSMYYCYRSPLIHYSFFQK
jgi:hypothetical protein